MEWWSGGVLEAPQTSAPRTQEPLINTGALARCQVSPSSWELVQQFPSGQREENQ